MRVASTARTRRRSTTALRVLGIDIGGSFLKAAVIDAHGRMLTDRLKLKTPHSEIDRIKRIDCLRVERTYMYIH